MKKRAVVWIRPQPHYRRDAFVSGLSKLGFTIVDKVPDPSPGDVLLSWNMYPSNESTAAYWRQCGAAVLIAENGYIGKDSEGRQMYALARDGHNGSGTWYVGSEDRWSRLNVPIQPRHHVNGPVIVRAQRGIGTKLMASPPRWERETASRIEKSGMKVEIRQHPANDLKQQRSDTDSAALARAGAVVVWSSSFGVKAVVAGVPVFYDAPYWIASCAAKKLPRPVDGKIDLTKDILLWDVTDDMRLKCLRALAWAQWSIDELSSGQPFEYLLSTKP